jgi:pimeloyl-ACP methyl ester carboxylesterase
VFERAAGVVAMLAVGLLRAQSGAQWGPQLQTVASTVDGTPQPYALYLPQSYDSQKEYPLLLSLHSEESNHRLNLAQVLGLVGRSDIGEAGLRFPPLRDADFIVACPLARGSMGYQGIPEQDVYDVLADVERRFTVDRDRVYLTGISMGGGGALWLAETHPDVWAGVAALCADSMPGSEELAANLWNVPVRLYHGEADTIVPVASSRAWQRRLLDLGVPAGYTEYPATRHNVWEIAYARGGVLDWLAGLHRDRSPARVRFGTRSYRYSSAYWVRIDGLTPGVLASMDARRVGGEVQVETRNVDGFTITGQESAVLGLTIDGAAVRLKSGAGLSFSKSAAGWRQGLYSPGGKRAGAEGPIAMAVSARHIYVYGSLGGPTVEELEGRRREAETAAGWSTTRSRLSLTLPVKADREVTAEDIESADLVLFGTAESNSVIARLSSRLPMELRPDAADYGLLFIAPVGKHYVLVSSGLPWWTGAEESGGAGYSWAPMQFRLLSGFGDYILFRGSVTQVVAEGRFDGNWKLPGDAAGRMGVTVNIH